MGVVGSSQCLVPPVHMIQRLSYRRGVPVMIVLAAVVSCRRLERLDKQLPIMFRFLKIVPYEVSKPYEYRWWNTIFAPKMAAL